MDDSDLDGLDPVAQWERETARVLQHLRGVPDDAALWQQPSRCAGWTVRDVVAHLTAEQEYFHACRDGTVQALMEAMGARGATDIESFNELGIREHLALENVALLRELEDRDARSRAGFRERGDGTVDTSVGEYPARWQAFHLAGEIATHADDIGVPVPADEQADRLAWRVRFSRFALKEAKEADDPVVEAVDGGTHVVLGPIDAVVDDDAFVEAVAGRLDDGSPLPADVRAALSTMP
jgi:uncharacterized protein (TIGR03083 family)